MNCPHCNLSIVVRVFKQEGAPPEAKAATGGRPSQSSPDEVLEFIGMLESIVANEIDLNDWETQFVESLRNKHNKYGDKLFVSPAQYERLRKIYEGR